MSYWDFRLPRHTWDEAQDTQFKPEMLDRMRRGRMMTTTFVNVAIKLLMHVNLPLYTAVHAIDPQTFCGSARDRNSVLDDVNLLLIPWEHKAHFTLMLAEFYQDECWCYHIDSLGGTTRADSDPQFAIFVDLVQGSRPSLRISRKTTIHTGLQTGGLDCAFWVLATCSYAMDRHAADLEFEAAAETRENTIAGIAAAFRTRETWEQSISAIRPVPTGSPIDVDASDDSSSPIAIDPPTYHVPDDDPEDPPPIYHVPDDDSEHVPADVPEEVPEEVTADVRVSAHDPNERWPGEIDNGPPPGPHASYQAVPFEQCYHCLNPHGLVRYVARNNTNAQKLWMNHLVQTGEPYWLCREHVCHNRIANPARACRDRATVIPPGRLKRPRGYLIPTASGKPKCWRHHREGENGRLNKQQYHKRKSVFNKQPVVRRGDAWNDP